MANALVDHLEVCVKLARAENDKLIEYLIKMALLEAKPAKKFHEHQRA